MMQLKSQTLMIFSLEVLIDSILVSGKLMPTLLQTTRIGLVTANIITSCYRESVKEIGLVGDMPDFFTTSVSSAGDPIAIFSLTGSERQVQSGGVSKWTRHKLQMFVITASSPLELEKVLIGMKKSRWWNHMATFWIFASFNGETGCPEALESLRTAWRINILKAKYICDQGVDGPSIYTFNPFADSAPTPWRVEQTNRGIGNHIWTLLSRRYSENTSICENIDFDQTKELGRYDVRITLSRGEVFPNYTKTGPISPYKETNVQLLTMSRYMKVTFKTVFSDNEPLGFVGKDGKGYGRLRYLVEGRSDIVILRIPISTMIELPRNYPFLYQKLFAVTQYTAYMTQWQKVISAIDRPSRIALSVVILVNVIVLKYVLHQPFMIAVLNTTRMVCNSCFTKLPSDLGSRIYLAGLFSFVVVIQALYQGQLSALLTKQVRLPNIDNYRDLVESDRLIYGWTNHSELFSDAAFQGRFFGIDFSLQKCTDCVSLNPLIACVRAKEWEIDDAVRLKLHVSRYPVLEVPVTYVLRKDWILEGKFNRHNSHYFESGLFDYDSQMAYVDEHRTLDRNENASSDEDFKVLSLEDLNFSFVILGLGLACAIIGFIAEFFIWSRGTFSVQTR